MEPEAKEQKIELHDPQNGNSAVQTSPAAPPAGAPQAATSAAEPNRALDLKFTGTAGEYFRIWIVNMFLSIVTLGIYAAWAKVRTRRYFYTHTVMDGQPFEYHAKPGAILKGHLIIGFFFLIYSLGSYIHMSIPFVVFGLFLVAFPFLAYQSLRFFAFNSSYRNVRFKFRGTLQEAYGIYLGLLFAVLTTSGILAPYMLYRMRKYFYDNMSFGNADNHFAGKPGRFYWYSFQTLCVGLAFLALLIGGGIFVYYNSLWADFFEYDIGLFAFFLIYLFVLSGFALVNQFFVVRITNYCWEMNQSEFVTFLSRLTVPKFLFIKITNILAIVFSVGLAIPWAKVRKTQYIIACLSVTAKRSLDDFGAGTDSETAAIGDAAADIFNFDVGL